MTEKTAEQFRAEAAQHDRDAAESFERCDTDGFLSQWASGINGQCARANAKIAEAGGTAMFAKTILLTIDGAETDARAVRTRFGKKWRLDSTDEWLPYMPARASTLAKRGYREEELREEAPAKAILDAPAGARGLSGASSVYVRIIRTDLDAAEGRQWRPVTA